MLFRVLIEKDPKNTAVVRVRPTALQIPGIYITDGNAASGPTSFCDLKEGRKTISKNWRTINSEWWNSVDGSKRKIMAECLVPIPPDLIDTVYVLDHETEPD